MTKKSKSTKQIRAIDRIIKFQIDDGIESLTISGKEVLADVAIDRQANVTLFLNADPDKINEIQSLVPFVTVQTVKGGTETDKTKTVTLSQDLTQFALEIADNSKELATLIKSQSSIVLDLNGLVQKLLEIAGKLLELEQKNKEQDQRLTTIEAKDQEQDERMSVIEEKNSSQDNRLNAVDMVQETLSGKVTLLENNLATVEENQVNQADTLKKHGERITVLETVKPSESSCIGCVKMFKELTGDATSFIVEEIPNESIIFLSILFERDGIHHVFTRNWFVDQFDSLQTSIANENVNIIYNGVNTLAIAFDHQALGFATVDVVVIKKGCFTDIKAHVETEDQIFGD